MARQAVERTTMKPNADNSTKPMIIPVDRERLRQDVQKLTSIISPRHAQKVCFSDKRVETLFEVIRKTGVPPEIKRFTQDGKKYKNVICSFGPATGERIIVSAHYDVQGN